MGVQGFPTLKIVKPGKKAGRPIVEDYQGPRTAKGIVEAVKDKIPNHVKRVTDKTLDEWLAEDSAKAVLLTDKGTTSPLLKALAIDFLGSISVAQIRDKEANAVSTLGVTSFPTLLLLPVGTTEPIVYDGEMTKEAMSAFLSQIAPPNPDPAPKASKPKSSKFTQDAKKSKSASSAFSKASASHESADSSASKATQTGETLENDGPPTESPNPIVDTDDTQKPIKLPEVAPIIPTLSTLEELQQACFTKTSKTCILAFQLSTELETGSATEQVILSLSDIHHKHTIGGHKLFPFYSVPASAGDEIRNALSLPGDNTPHLIAVNAKRSWLKKFPGADLDRAALEDWVDAIRMGDGAKEALPDELIVEATATPTPAAETPAAESKEPLEFIWEELTPEMEEEMLREAEAAAKKREREHEEHDEL